MEWLTSLLTEHSVIQAVIVVSLVSAVGLALGKNQYVGRVARSNFRVFRGHRGRAFRIVDRSADVELRGEFRVDYLRVCLGGTGGTWFSLPWGKVD